MRIDDEAVGAFDAVVASTHAGCREAGAAVGAVDVEPHAQLGGHVGRGGEVVDDPRIGGAARGDDGEHPLPVARLEGSHGFAQVLHVQAALVVGGDLHLVGVHRPACLGDAAVSALRADDEAAGSIEPALAPLPPPVPGSDECAEVAGRATADEHAARRCRHAGQVGDVAQRLVLGEHGSATLHPRSGIDAGCADDEVEQDAGLGGGRRHERQEPRVVDRDARRGEHIAEHTQRLQPAEPTLGDGAPGHRRQLGKGAGAVERGLHPHPIDGVAHDGLREHFGGHVVQVHGCQSARRVEWLLRPTQR